MRIIPGLFLLVALAGCSHPGWSYLQKGDYRAAEIAFHDMLRNEPKEGAYIGLHKSYVGLAKLDSAEYFLKEGLRIYPKDEFINFCAAQYYSNIVHNDSLGKIYLQKTKGLAGPKMGEKMEESIQKDKTK
ncbi:MAG: hypothetical protein EHM64_16805 [Ignavibacteriae bacterium]|nr:MAG: hypothetical protein EHM64_16805 [Ignavibacteriota bacterium]